MGGDCVNLLLMMRLSCHTLIKLKIGWWMLSGSSRIVTLVWCSFIFGRPVSMRQRQKKQLKQSLWEMAPHFGIFHIFNVWEVYAETALTEYHIHLKRLSDDVD